MTQCLREESMAMCKGGIERIPQSEITYDSRCKEESNRSKAEMVRPDER